jgi:hypothetical protein
MRLLWLLWMLVPVHSFAQDGIVVRTSVAPEQAWVGQRVILRIDVLSEDGWAQIPDLGDVRVDGAYVVRTESQGVRLTEGASTGQRYQLSIYPQVDGRLEIPALPVTVAVKRWGVTDGDEEHRLETPPTEIQVRIPPGAQGVRGLVTTGRLVADQTWSAAPDTVQLGDAVTRTVNLQADDISGMAFPPLQHRVIEGVGIYPGEAQVEDTANRGALRGERIETVTYVVEKSGPVALPPIELAWWNPVSQTLRTVTLEGLEFVAVGAPEAVVTAEHPVEEASGSRWPWLLVGVLFVVGLIWWFRGPVAAWRRRRRESEGRYFADAMRAVRSGNAHDALSSVMRWLDRIEDGTLPARMDQFLDRYGNEGARAEADRLLDCLASGTKMADAGKLASAFKGARKNWRASIRRQRAAAAVLPELNG